MTFDPAAIHTSSDRCAVVRGASVGDHHGRSASPVDADRLRGIAISAPSQNAEIVSIAVPTRSSSCTDQYGLLGCAIACQVSSNSQNDAQTMPASVAAIST